MPTLPLPSPGTRVDAGALPVASIGDVLAAFPSFVQRSDDAPVRDGLAAALLAMLETYQARAGYAAAMSDLLRAKGAYLVQIGTERGIFKADGEDDDAYRARILTIPDLVTPSAILAAANAILAPYTTVKARYLESLGDRWFVRQATANPAMYPRAYIYQRASIPRSPDYPDRLYESEADINGGYAVTGREPGAARLFSDNVGRYFVLRVPDLSSVGATVAPIYAETQTARGFFIGSTAGNSSFVYATTATPLAIYQAICNVVQRIKGHSMRWELLVDPQLVS